MSAPSSLIIETTGEEDKINALYNLLQTFRHHRSSCEPAEIAMVRRQADDSEGQIGGRLGAQTNGAREAGGTTEAVDSQIGFRTSFGTKESNMVTIYYDSDSDLGMLDRKTIGIIGYGSQGHAHALNLKDNGQKVIVGLHPDRPQPRQGPGSGPGGCRCAPRGRDG